MSTYDTGWWAHLARSSVAVLTILVPRLLTWLASQGGRWGEATEPHAHAATTTTTTCFTLIGTCLPPDTVHERLKA